MNLASWFSGPAVNEDDVRAEIWRLGTHYHGGALEGAVEELRGRDLSGRKAKLLRACIKKLQSP